MPPIFVPADLLDALDRKVSALAMPALERRIVTAYIIAGGGSVRAWAQPVTLLAATVLWPSHMVSKPVRNVLSILLELEVLGVVVSFEPCEGGYAVVRRKELAA